MHSVWILEAQNNYEAGDIVRVFNHLPTQSEIDAAALEFISAQYTPDSWEVNEFPVHSNL